MTDFVIIAYKERLGPDWQKAMNNFHRMAMGIFLLAKAFGIVAGFFF